MDLPVYSEDSPTEYPMRFLWRNNGPGTAQPGQYFKVKLEHTRHRRDIHDKSHIIYSFGQSQNNPRFTPANQDERNTFTLLASGERWIELSNLRPILPGETVESTITWSSRHIAGRTAYYWDPYLSETEIRVGEAGPPTNDPKKEFSPFYVHHDATTHPIRHNVTITSVSSPQQNGHYAENGQTRHYENSSVQSITLEVHLQNDGPDPMIPGINVLVRRGRAFYQATANDAPVESTVNTLQNPRIRAVPGRDVAAYAEANKSESHFRAWCRRYLAPGTDVPFLVDWTVLPIPASAPAGIYSQEIIIEPDQDPMVANSAPNNGKALVIPATFRKV